MDLTPNIRKKGRKKSSVQWLRLRVLVKKIKQMQKKVTNPVFGFDFGSARPDVWTDARAYIPSPPCTCILLPSIQGPCRPSTRGEYLLAPPSLLTCMHLANSCRERAADAQPASRGGGDTEAKVRQQKSEDCDATLIYF